MRPVSQKILNQLVVAFWAIRAAGDDAGRDQWNGTLMMVVQPAKERVIGAKAMKADHIWDRFGIPDYALAFHVNSNNDPVTTERLKTA
jgi:metal-dependent amidase/aminoacylase/carboxypeptidase family protein